MALERTQELWSNLLDWTYDRIIVGVPGVDTASTLALHFNKEGITANHQVTALIRRQQLLAGSSGFLTGLGGFLTLPFAIPANMASVIFIQMRMIAAIAHIGGYDLDDRRVRSMIIACMAGNAAKDILQEMGIVAGKKATQKLICNISTKSLCSINQRVGFALLTKTGGRGFINISKAVPLAGGIIGGTFDVVTTALIGRIARKLFIPAA